MADIFDKFVEIVNEWVKGKNSQNESYLNHNIFVAFTDEDNTDLYPCRNLAMRMLINQDYDKETDSYIYIFTESYAISISNSEKCAYKWFKDSEEVTCKNVSIRDIYLAKCL